MAAGDRSFTEKCEHAHGDFGENGCTGETEKRSTNGKRLRPAVRCHNGSASVRAGGGAPAPVKRRPKLDKIFEDRLSSPFNLRCSVSPVNPCPPSPPCPGRHSQLLPRVSGAERIRYTISKSLALCDIAQPLVL